MRSSIAVLTIALGLAQAGPIIKRDLTVQTLNGWYSWGCVSDSQSARTLDTAAHFGPHVSDTNCQYQCEHLNAGYTFAGTEYSGQCYCGNTLNAAVVAENLTDCNMACTGDSTQPCGAGNRMNLFSTSPPPANFSGGSASGSSAPAPVAGSAASAGPYQYAGCWTDTIGSRALPNQLTPSGAVDVESCQQAAMTASYSLFMVEYGNQCYAGNAIMNGQTQSDESSCSMTCAGNSSEICGGPGRGSLYSLNGATPTVASPPASSASAATIQSSTSLPQGWGYRGCYTDNNGARGLTGLFVNEPAGGMTVEYCISACSSAGFQIASTEYSKECRCGNAIMNGAGLAPDGETGCNMKCDGSNEICGGPNRQSLYSTGGANGAWIALGCFSDNRAARTLANTLTYQGNLTTEIALATCQADGYVLCGTEYGNELYGANALGNNGGPASDGNAGCSFAAAGNSSEIAGGANRLSAYGFVSPDGQIHTAAAPAGTPTPSPVQAAPNAGPTAQTSGLPTGWSYANCYVDNTNARILANQQPSSSTLTPSSCISACQAAGQNYTVASVEYGSQCFCDTVLRNSAQVASSASSCNMACSGDSTTECGAGGYANVYSMGPITVQAAAVPQTSGLPAGFSYAGCVADSVNARVLSIEKDMPGTADASTCLSYCQSQGYAAGGIEYSNQCMCGTAAQASAALQNTASCSMLCDGAQQYICGGPGAITLYTSS